MADKIISVKDLSLVIKQRAAKEVDVHVHSSQVEEYEKNGFFVKKARGRKTIMSKQKTKGEIFEDAIWLMFHRLGATHLNESNQYTIGDGNDSKQIDVCALFNDYAFVIECKFSDSENSSVDRDDIDAFVQRIPTQRKYILQTYNVKDVFFLYSTTGFRGFMGSKNHARLVENDVVWLGEKEISYVGALINGYKDLAYDLFVNTMLVKKGTVNSEPLRVNALKTNFASHEAYVITLNSELLRKLSVVPHRSYGHVDSTLASYQRLVRYNRLSQIKKFIDSGGYFANSIVVAIKDDVNVSFEGVSAEYKALGGDIGLLMMSRDRAVFNIIDGQHRVFGHSLSDRSLDEALSVVALKGIDTSDQLKLFMDINQNQKKVSAKLRLDLQEDLFYDSKYPSKRMLALTSRVIRNLDSSSNSSIGGNISIGDNTSGRFSSIFLANGIKLGKYLPKSIGLKWSQNELSSVIYDVFDNDQNNAMEVGIHRLHSILESNINIHFDAFQTSYLSDIQLKFIDSNRGILTFIKVIGDFLSYSARLNNWNTKTKISIINSHLKPISEKYIDFVKEINNSMLNELVSLQGAQVAKEWSIHVNSQISKHGYTGYYEDELEEMSVSRSNAIYFSLTEKIKSVETLIKRIVINQMQHLDGETWDASFGEIKYESLKRAEQHNDEIRKKGLEEELIEWHHKLMLIDYRKMILKKWSLREKDSDISFQKLFTIPEFTGKSSSKEDSTAWIIDLNELRNKWAHSGTNNASFDDDDLEIVNIIEEHLSKKLLEVDQVFSY